MHVISAGRTAGINAGAPGGGGLVVGEISSGGRANQGESVAIRTDRPGGEIVVGEIADDAAAGCVKDDLLTGVVEMALVASGHRFARAVAQVEGRLAGGDDDAGSGGERATDQRIIEIKINRSVNVDSRQIDGLGADVHKLDVLKVIGIGIAKRELVGIGIGRVIHDFTDGEIGGGGGFGIDEESGFRKSAPGAGAAQVGAGAEGFDRSAGEVVGGGRGGAHA